MSKGTKQFRMGRLEKVVAILFAYENAYDKVPFTESKFIAGKSSGIGQAIRELQLEFPELESFILDQVRKKHEHSKMD